MQVLSAYFKGYWYSSHRFFGRFFWHYSQGITKSQHWETSSGFLPQWWFWNFAETFKFVQNWGFTDWLSSYTACRPIQRCVGEWFNHSAYITQTTVCMGWTQLRQAFCRLVYDYSIVVNGSESLITLQKHLQFSPTGSCPRGDPTSYPVWVLNGRRNACLAYIMSSNCIVWGLVDIQLIDLCVRLHIRRSF